MIEFILIVLVGACAQEFLQYIMNDENGKES